MVANGREIVHILESNGVELRIQDGRLIGRWSTGGPMPEGAAGFIRHFRSEIIDELERRTQSIVALFGSQSEEVQRREQESA